MAGDRGYRSVRSEDTFLQFIEGVEKLLFFAGCIVCLISVGFLAYYYVTFSDGNAPAQSAQAMRNILMFQKLLVPGVIAVAISSTLLYWGEDVLSVLQLLLAGVLFFSPMWLPLVFGVASGDRSVAAAAAKAIQHGGAIFGVGAIGVAVADVIARARDRIKLGAKADHLRYGKGVKEEYDIQHVLLGKCWQMPFCRKFVRERCPIYHSRRTCWKERVGCMCEERVIQNAMEGRVIPKDAVAAAKMIPQNSRLSASDKAERCRQCIIYNERQRQKYKVSIPGVLVVFGSIYGFGHSRLIAGVQQIITQADRWVGDVTFSSSKMRPESSGMAWFNELVLLCLMMIALAYTMKFVEFLIFKLKV